MNGPFDENKENPGKIYFVLLISMKFDTKRCCGLQNMNFNSLWSIFEILKFLCDVTYYKFRGVIARPKLNIFV